MNNEQESKYRWIITYECWKNNLNEIHIDDSIFFLFIKDFLYIFFGFILEINGI